MKASKRVFGVLLLSGCIAMLLTAVHKPPVLDQPASQGFGGYLAPTIQTQPAAVSLRPKAAKPVRWVF